MATSVTLLFKPAVVEPGSNNTGDVSLSQRTIRISINSATMSVEYIYIEPHALANYLDTDTNPATPYTPAYPWSPATKKYVDDSVSWTISRWTTAPSSPVEWQLWYDTANDVLKVYDGTQWKNVDTDTQNNWIDVTVTTAYTTAAKVWTTTSGNYTPTKWDFLLVNFVNGCSVWNPTLNIDNSSAINIKLWNTNATADTFNLWSGANSNVKVLMYYDGDYYKIWSVANTTYSAMSVSEWETWTATWQRTMRADYLKQIIKYHAVDDTAYSSAWSWEDDIAPSKKAVYNKIESLSSSIPSSSATAPANPTEWQLWYDTTNDVLKVYDWTNWNVVWDDTADINTKTFYLSSTSDLTTAQAAYDWWINWKNSIIIFSWSTYFQDTKDSTSAYFYKSYNSYETQDNKYTLISLPKIKFNVSSGTVTSVLSVVWSSMSRVLATNVDYSAPYTPLYNGSPATKKYVDDSVSWAVSKWSTAPSSPVEWQLWYDTTNDVLKSYNWTTWVEVWWWATTNVLRFDIWERYWLNDLIWESVANIVDAWDESWTGTEWKNTIILTANDWQSRRYDFLVTSVTDSLAWQWAIHAITYSNSDEFYDSMQQSLWYLDIYYDIDTKICTNIQEFPQSPTTRLDSPFTLDFIWLWTEADYQDITEPNPQTLYLTMDIPLKSYQEIVAMTNVQDVYNELNLQPARYIQKFTSEWHFYNSANWKWLSSDWTIWNIPTWWNYRIRVASWADTFDYTTTTPAP